MSTPHTTFKQHEWECEDPQCIYTQTMEPTRANQNRHFNLKPDSSLYDLQPNECPSCAQAGRRGVRMKKAPPGTSRTRVSFLRLADKQALFDKIDSKPRGRIIADSIERDETQEEVDARVDDMVETRYKKEGLGSQAKKDLKRQIKAMATPNKIVEHTYVDEPEEVDLARKQMYKDRVKGLTEKQEADLRKAHENTD